MAKYDVSLSVLRRIAERGVVAKTGIMVGLGETEDEVRIKMPCQTINKHTHNKFTKTAVRRKAILQQSFLCVIDGSEILYTLFLI